MASLKLVRSPIPRVSFDSWFQAMYILDRFDPRHTNFEKLQFHHFPEPTLGS